MNERLIVVDRFAGGLTEGWSWLREEPAARQFTADALLLRALPGTLWGPNNTARNYLLRPDVAIEAGLASQVTVTNDPELQGEQGGLIWYRDDDNYVKLIKECLDGRVWIVLAREEAGSAVLINKLPVPTESATLRLWFTGDRMLGQFRTGDAEEWQTVGDCAPVGQSHLQLGVYAQGGLADSEHWAAFTDFKVLELGA